MSILIQTIEKNRPVVFFYRLVHLDETAEDAETLKEAIKYVLEKVDELWDIVKKKLVGLITDGASTMTGYKSGLGKRMEKAIGRPIRIRHHCLSHRYTWAQKWCHPRGDTTFKPKCRCFTT